jgi:hypothetical protein
LTSLPAVSPVAAQTLTVGAEGGINIATLTADPAAEPPITWMPALTLGGFVMVRAAGIDWQVEGLYSIKGGRVFESPNVDIQIAYVELPVAARLALRKLGLPAFSAFGGATFAVKLDAKVKDAGESTDVNDNFQKSDVGLTGGVLYEQGRLIASGRYTHGLRNIAVPGQAINEQTVRNQAFTVMVGWKVK